MTVDSSGRVGDSVPGIIPGVIDDKLLSSSLDSLYKPIDKNWYQQSPYTFLFTDKDNNTKYFNLPIAPYNITINTHFATNVISTMYGTVEEHSEQRYFDIMISGTTGMGPKSFRPTDSPDGYELIGSNMGLPTRSFYRVDKNLFEKTGLFRRTRELVNKVINDARGVFDGPDAINSPITSGISDSASGYIAFHNFYRFLLNYKKDAASGGGTGRSEHPLQFINYKDNNKYDVSINNFQLMRDQRNPMLYNYSIAMRAYNLKDANAGKSESSANLLEDLGLNGIETSNFASVANKVRKAKNAAYALIAAAKGVGK